MATSTPSAEPSSQVLSATYNSPTNAPFTHEQKISTPPSPKTSDRTTYLAALRAATVTLQEDINRELTARMEEDKALDITSASAKKGVDESREEDNYGEEVVEED